MLLYLFSHLIINRKLFYHIVRLLFYKKRIKLLNKLNLILEDLYLQIFKLIKLIKKYYFESKVLKIGLH
jgi:hypothetical protein